MMGFVVAMMRLIVQTQIVTIRHLIFLHKMLGSEQSNYIELQQHTRILNDAAEMLERNQP